MRSRFDSSRFDSSLIGLQWALRFLLIVMAAAALAACSDDPTGNGGGVANVQVTAAATQVEMGDTVLLAAAPKRADGTTNTSATVTWLSTDTSVATVQPRAGQKAIVRGKAPGMVRIHATAGAKTGELTMTVIVTQAPVPVLDSISPSSVSAGSPMVTVRVRGQHFSEMTLVRWNDVAIATQFISSTEVRGLVPAAQLVQTGNAVVTVRTGPPGGGTSTGKTFSILPEVAAVRVDAQETVVWIGEQIRLSATPIDKEGRDLPGRATQWQSTEEEIVKVDQNGVVTPVGAGLATVYATVDGRLGSASVYSVEPPPYDLMYESNRGGIRELWITSFGANATPRRWLPAGFHGEDAATSRDGSRIAFVSRDQYLNSDVWVANRDGSGLTRLTFSEGSDDQPTWSPDGSQIAFRSTRAGYSDIWVMNADGSGATTVTGGQYRFGNPASQRPSWGQNGLIYFSFADADVQPVTWQLASVRADGTDMRIHTSGGYSDTDPTVSWDGSKLALRRSRGSTDYGVIITQLNGNELFMINQPGLGQMPAWARNDQWIALVRPAGANGPANEIYVTRLNAIWKKHITTGVALGGGRNPVFVRR